MAYLIVHDLRNYLRRLLINTFIYSNYLFDNIFVYFASRKVEALVLERREWLVDECCAGLLFTARSSTNDHQERECRLAPILFPQAQLSDYNSLLTLNSEALITSLPNMARIF